MKRRISAEEHSIRKRAAALSVLMHGLLLAAMVVMIDWKAVHVNPSVMEATLWDSLPAKTSKPVPKPPEPVKPPEPEPEPKPEPKPEPEEVTDPPKAEKAEQAADIALKKREDDKKRKLEEEKLKEEKRQEQLKKLQDELRKQEEDDKLKKVQEAMRQQELDAQQAAAASATADPSVLSYYVGLMTRKIRSNVNPGLCPVNNPQLLIELKLTSSGDIAGQPKLVKGSGDSVCDDAVLRAVLVSKPFDLPADDPAAKKQLMDLLLKFKPRG